MKEVRWWEVGANGEADRCGDWGGGQEMDMGVDVDVSRANGRDSDLEEANEGGDGHRGADADEVDTEGVTALQLLLLL